LITASPRRFLPLQRKQLPRELALSKLNPAVFERPKPGLVLPIEVWARRRPVIHWSGVWAL